MVQRYPVSQQQIVGDTAKHRRQRNPSQDQSQRAGYSEHGGQRQHHQVATDRADASPDQIPCGGFNRKEADANHQRQHRAFIHAEKPRLGQRVTRCPLQQTGRHRERRTNQQRRQGTRQAQRVDDHRQLVISYTLRVTQQIARHLGQTVGTGAGAQRGQRQQHQQQQAAAQQPPLMTLHERTASAAAG